MISIELLKKSNEYKYLIEIFDRKLSGISTFSGINTDDRVAKELYNICKFIKLMTEDFINETKKKYGFTYIEELTLDRLKNEIYNKYLEKIIYKVGYDKIYRITKINQDLEDIISSFQKKRNFISYSRSYDEIYNVRDFLSDNGYNPEDETIEDMYGID